MTTSLPEHAQPMEVMNSVNAAIARTRRMLFQPFNLSKWVVLGVIIFLDVWFGGGRNFGGGGNFNPGGGQWQSMRDIGDSLLTAEEWVLSNLTLVLAIGIPFMLVMVVFTVAVLWLTSRGQMMFIRAVALDDEQLGPNWRETRVPAWSLFRFRLVLAAIGYVLGLFVMVFGYLTARGILLSEEPEIWILLGALVPYIILLVVFGVCFGLISLFLRGFVSPLMFHLNCPCVEAWRVFLNLLSGNVLSLLGYVGIKIAYQIAFGLVAMLVGCVTCCIGMLPVIHHALFAPFYVFDRAFPMYMLGSLGPDFTLIRERVQNGGPDSLPPLP